MKVVITGISGALARMVAARLARTGHTVIGIDRRPWPDPPAGVEMHAVDVLKRPAEDVFRTRHPDAVIHMATVTWQTARRDERTRINLGGTQAVWQYCARYGVKAALFIGRHTVYGAAPDAPLFRTEDEPLLAGSTFPNLADLVAADLYAGNALWRLPDLRTAVLRMAYTLGPSRRGTLASYLAGPRVPTVLGYDPLFQFMHEDDAVSAIALALEKQLRGVFNVAGPQAVPLSLLCHATGRTVVPLPAPIFPSVLGRFGFPRMPRASVNHIKYPIVVDDRAFRAATGFAPKFDEGQTMESFHWA
ncbi:MAG: NAD-dependent epimerase/dehydratase family protein [Myxococcales bacterium]|nr:NAD-dependent epimerase/dehydratase family protein [Myxococcales bacterium]